MHYGSDTKFPQSPQNSSKYFPLFDPQCTVTSADLVKVDEDAAQRLSPLAPSERIELLNHPEFSRQGPFPEYGVKI